MFHLQIGNKTEAIEKQNNLFLGSDFYVTTCVSAQADLNVLQCSNDDMLA